MTFDELPPLLDGAQAIEWILTGDTASAMAASLGKSDDAETIAGCVGGWWERARYRHGLEGRIAAVDAALNRLYDALRSGTVRARVAGRDVDAIEWAAVGIVDREPNLLMVYDRAGRAPDLSGKPIAVYRDDLLKLREPTSRRAPLRAATADLARLVDWFKERVASWPEKQPTPSREHDIAAARAAGFDIPALQDAVRKVRAKHAPPTWLKSGRKGHKAAAELQRQERQR
jgi:hypothetical protein